MFKKLKTIMVICFVFVNALFLAGVSYISYQYFFNFTSDEISEARLTLLNESANNLSSMIKNISEAGMFIALDQSVRNIFDEQEPDPYHALGERTELNNIINNVASLKEEIYSIELYTDRYEHLPYIYDDNINPESDLEDKKWFANFIEDVDSGWVPNHLDERRNEEIISYIHRIMDHRNETVGYIKVNILADKLLDLLVDTDLYEEINEPFLLLNTGGNIIAETHSRRDFPILNELTVQTDDGLFERLQPEYDSLVNHHQLIRHNNEHFLLLISQRNYEQWRLVQFIPVDDLYANMQDTQTFILVIGMVAIILSIPIVFGVGKWITKPIGQMIKGMRKVEKGDFTVQIPEHSIEEYDILAKNFNRMTEQLAETLKRLEKENKNRREAELNTLQSQIMPHFLYNTLDMIKWRSLDYQADDVGAMIGNLSKMLRIGLSGGLQFIRLRDELEHAKSYVDIQEQRQRAPIDYKVRIPADMKDLYVPKVILQPFIENSVKHGYPASSSETMRITILGYLYKKENYMQVLIKDNGIGLQNHHEANPRGGIGIKNVRERIAMYCGDKFNVKLYNAEEGGTTVEITLPIFDKEPITAGDSQEKREEP